MSEHTCVTICTDHVKDRVPTIITYVVQGIGSKVLDELLYIFQVSISAR